MKKNLNLSVYPQRQTLNNTATTPLTMAELIRKRKTDAQRRRRHSMSPARKEVMKKKAAEAQRLRRASMTAEEKEKRRQADRERYARMATLKRLMRPPIESTLISKHQFLLRRRNSLNNFNKDCKQLAEEKQNDSCHPVFEVS